MTQRANEQLKAKLLRLFDVAHGQAMGLINIEDDHYPELLAAQRKVMPRGSMMAQDKSLTEMEICLCPKVRASNTRL